MKKLVFVLCLLLVGLLGHQNVFCEELNDENVSTDEVLIYPTDTIIVDMDYYPSSSLGGKNNINLIWKTRVKMDTLSIKMYSMSSGNYIEVYNMDWDLEDPLVQYNVIFQILDTPEDDPNTEIDESLEQFYTYLVSFKLETKTMGVIGFIFDYTANSNSYSNPFYIPNLVNPTIILNSYAKKNVFSSKNSFIVVSICAIASVMATFVIINSSKKKRYEDENE